LLDQTGESNLLCQNDLTNIAPLYVIPERAGPVKSS
jgi:hypothetical protein